MLSVAFDCLLKSFYTNPMNLKIILVTRPHAYITCKQYCFFSKIGFSSCEASDMQSAEGSHTRLALRFHPCSRLFIWLLMHSWPTQNYGLFCSLVLTKSILLNVKLELEILHEAFGFWVSFCFKLFVYSVLLIKAKEIMVNRLCKNNFLSSLLEQVNHT